jgi:hypothetical protein
MVMAQFKALSQNLTGGTNENHKTPQSEIALVSGLRFESRTLQIQRRSSNSSIVTFGGMSRESVLVPHNSINLSQTLSSV